MGMTMTKKQKISLGVVSVLLSVLLAASGVMIYRELSSKAERKDDFKEPCQKSSPSRRQSHLKQIPLPMNPMLKASRSKPDGILRNCLQ